jgi:crotonobetainyl-CoA:carnitine CoA-transferase CaiB-like acyl-CoA transferase
METEIRERLLSGYKVMDFTQYLAGPAATRLMVEMGAEVIKVELAPRGDNTRATPYVKNGRSGYFVQQNCGKKSLCVDVRTEAGKNVVKELIRKMDVLIENFAPGAIGRMGFDYEAVKALNPRLVMCSISAFGQNGPLASLPGYDYIGAAYAGVLDLVGMPQEPPVMLGLSLGDNLTGLCALSAILAALLYRERSNKGQFIDVSLLDSYFQSHDMAVQFASASEGQSLRKRVGRRDPNVVPVGIFKSKAHYVAILAPADHQWKPLCEANPHLVQRGTIRPVNDPILGKLELPGSPLRFSDFPPRSGLEAPLLGEHNLEILRDYLGYSPAQISQLHSQGVLVTKPV